MKRNFLFCFLLSVTMICHGQIITDLSVLEAEKGMRENPYSVSECIQMQSDKTVAWMCGYIIGTVPEQETNVSSGKQMEWEAPFSNNHCVVLASSPSERDIRQCVFVNLSKGPMRNMVNLVDHPENIGCLFFVKGVFRNYYGFAGVRDADGSVDSFFVQNGGADETEEVVPQGLFVASFATDVNGFEVQNIVMDDGVRYVWKHDARYECMKAMAYFSKKNHISESWLISPAINLSKVRHAELSFEQAAKYGDHLKEHLTVWVSTNYNGDVSKARWRQLEVLNYPSGKDWKFVGSGKIDLTRYTRKSNVRIAFKYVSTSDEAATWELRNVVVK